MRPYSEPNIEVAVAAEPIQSGVHAITPQVEALEVTGPHREFGEQQQPERRRVHGTEVGSVRDGAQPGQLPPPKLVHDLAGLFLPERAVVDPLVAAQKADRGL